MKDASKILIILTIALNNSTLFAQMGSPFNSDKDTLAINLAKDTLTTSTIQDSLAINTNNDSIVTKQDEINVMTDSALYYRLFFLHHKDSLPSNYKRTYNKDSFKFKYDSFREKMKEPWLGDILKNIFFR